VLLVLAALVLIVVPSAAADSSYRDTAEDSDAVIDITTVTVSDDAAGRIRFSIDIPGAPQQPADGVFVLFLNVDRNRSTGDPSAFGAEYAFQLVGAQRTAAFARWNGMSYDTIRGSSFAAGYDRGPTVEVDRHDIGGESVHGIDFWMRAVQGSGNAVRFDHAPDDGTWTYELAGGIPAVGLPLRLQVAGVKASPRRPVGGRRFIVTMAVTRSDGASVLGLMECTARLRDKPLQTSSTLWRNRVSCALVVPGRAARGILTLRIAIRSETAVLIRTLSFRVAE